MSLLADRIAGMGDRTADMPLKQRGRPGFDTPVTQWRKTKKVPSNMNVLGVQVYPGPKQVDVATCGRSSGNQYNAMPITRQARQEPSHPLQGRSVQGLSIRLPGSCLQQVICLRQYHSATVQPAILYVWPCMCSSLDHDRALFQLCTVHYKLQVLWGRPTILYTHTRTSLTA